MSALIERLTQLTQVQRVAAFLVLCAALVAGWWFGLYAPSGAAMEQLRAKNVELTQQKQQVEARAWNKPKFEEDLRQLVAELKQALKELPNQREIPGLLKGISTLGKRAGLEVNKFTPLPENTREYVAEVPVALELEGSFHEVALFFDRLSKMPRIVYVQDVEMSNPRELGGKVVLAVKGTAVTFRFLSDEEAGAASAEKPRAVGREARE